jgi:hypothetical protein
MNPPPKHLPFDSIYRPDFEVVEERQGRLSLFPHTDQLPLLLRALNLEFYGPLPGHVARVDRRADGFHKYMIKLAALMYCLKFNAGRKDGLQLMSLPDADMVTRLTLVQQITESSRLGRFHRFRFYGSNGFFPDIHLSGKRLAFADHVLDRFSSRVPNRVGEDLAIFLAVFYGTPFISLPVGQGRAFMLEYHESLLAFTYTETPEEYFVTTCLTINEINSLRPELPPVAHNLHYGRDFVRPKIRNWMPLQQMIKIYKRWQGKIPLPPPLEKGARFKNWNQLAPFIKDSALRQGHGPGTRLGFLDQIPGPFVLESKPGQTEGAFDEQAAFEKVDPNVDWAAAFAQMEATTAETPEQHRKRTGK